MFTWLNVDLPQGGLTVEQGFLRPQVLFSDSAEFISDVVRIPQPLSALLSWFTARKEKEKKKRKNKKKPPPNSLNSGLEKEKSQMPLF